MRRGYFCVLFEEKSSTAKLLNSFFDPLKNLVPDLIILFKQSHAKAHQVRAKRRDRYEADLFCRQQVVDKPFVHFHWPIIAFKPAIQ